MRQCQWYRVPKAFILGLHFPPGYDSRVGPLSGFLQLVLDVQGGLSISFIIPDPRIGINRILCSGYARVLNGCRSAIPASRMPYQKMRQEKSVLISKIEGQRR